MLSRLFTALPLVVMLLFPAAAQVYVCDFGSTHPHVVVKQIVFKTSIQLSPRSQRALRDSILQLSRQTHSQGWVGGFPEDAEELVREAYQNNGFFNASATGEVGMITDRGAFQAINLTFHIVPGNQYRLGPMLWKGNSAISAGELERAVGVQAGEIFRRKHVADGLSSVNNLYLSHGYINVTLVPYPTLDENRKIVSFEIDIEEGKQFRFGELATHGIEDQHRRILLSAWSQLRGKTYSPRQADEFFQSFFKPLRAGISPNDYTQRFVNEVAGSVDYSLSLTRDPALDTAR